MKKFLTVLLVIAVMFTFSFGSAMAATTESLTTAQKHVESVLKVAENTARITNASTYSQSAIDYAAAQIQSVSSMIMSGVIDAIEKDTTTYPDGIDGAAGMNKFKEEFNKWADVDTSADPAIIGTGNLAFAKTSYADYFAEFATAQNVKGVVADAKAVLAAINTEIYSTKTCTVTESGKKVDYTYKTYAEKLIKDANDALDKVTESSKITSITSSTYKDYVNGLLYGYDSTSGNEVVYTKDTPKKSLPKADNAANHITAGVIGKLEALETVESQAEKDELNKANLEYAKSILAYEAKVAYYNTVKVEEGTDVTAGAKNPFYDTISGKVAGVTVEKANKLTKAEATAVNTAIAKKIADAVDVLTVYLDEYDGDSAYSTLVGTVAGTNGFFATPGGFKATIDKTKAAMDAYVAVERLAAQRKAELLFDGTKAYDDAAIDEALAKDKIDIYSNYADPTLATKKYVEKVPQVTDPVAVAIANASKKFKDNMVLSGKDKTADEDKKYCKDYYYTTDAATAYKYDLIKAETLEKLNDAKTEDEVNSIMAAADERLAVLRTADENTASLATAIAKYKAALEDYAKEQCKLLNKENTTTTDIYRPVSFLDKTPSNGITSALEAGNDILDAVKNEAALPAAYEKAKALFANIKTDADLKAEATKVMDMLKALPATVDKKLSTEEQFMEAAKAYNAYLDLYGAQKSDIAGYLVFDSKLATLKTYQQTAVVDAINALDDLKPITVEDKDAVKAVRDKLEGYLKFYGIDSALYNGTTDGKTPVKNFAVSNYKDATPNAAIDTLTDYEDAVWDAEVTNVENMIRKLTDASTEAEVKAVKDAYDALTGSQQRAVKATLGEAFLYKLDKIAEEAVAKVEALKLTAKSTAKKGSITVTWTVKGDASVVDGYQIWKSTKQSSGYKKAFTTKKTSYKNTKGLKKGKTYYYKVRAYKVVDGKNVYSDWSNKAYRKAK